MTEQLLLAEHSIDNNREKSPRLKRVAQFLLKTFVHKPVEAQIVQAPISEEITAPAEKTAPTAALPQRTPSTEVDSAFQSAVKAETDTQSTPIPALPQREKQETDTAFSYSDVAEKSDASNVILLSSRVVAESTPLPQRAVGGLDAFSYVSPKPRLTSVPDVDPLTGPITVSENDPTPMHDAVALDAETPEFARLKAEFAARAAEPLDK